MSEAFNSYKLSDYRRQQLGSEREPTCETKVHDGVTATREGDWALCPTTCLYFYDQQPEHGLTLLVVISR